MPVAMSLQKSHLNNKQLKVILTKEFNFLKSVFSALSLPQAKVSGDNSDDDLFNDNIPNTEEKELPKRARSIAELEEKLEKLKTQKKFNLKNKLVKKSITSKLNKKMKKKERQKNNKMKFTKEKLAVNEVTEEERDVKEIDTKPKASQKVFNAEGKLVFSKFDFSGIGQTEKSHKKREDPKKTLENLKQQEQRLKELEGKEEGSKVKEVKEKMAWKNIFLKAEGQKVKDDPTLLKKSIKKMDQKKKHSKKQWDQRIQNVEQKKDEKQKKRRENISKKKKEKKTKVHKAAAKRGRVVL